MRFLFFICILFSLISWGVVFPINRKQENDDSKKKENPQEKPFGKRECNRFRNFVGSNLFDGSRKICFSPEDVNLLVARRQFEIMIPKELPPGLLDDKTVNHILRYFYYGFWIFRRLEDSCSRRIMEKAFYDTLGGFLRYYLVPVCKFSYYASKVELRTVRNVLFLYQKCRDFLNTNGNGWRMPMRNPLQELKSVKINPIRITEEETMDVDDKVCSDLDLTPSNNGIEVVDDFMIVSLPKIDTEDNGEALNNIWLPFLRKRTFNLRSCKSAFILVKYYRSVSRCYKKKSVPQKRFDRTFRQWIVENLKMHLSDDEFYPGLGGVLNVYENTVVGEPAAMIQIDGNDDDDDDESLKGANILDPIEIGGGIKKRDLSDSIFNEVFVDDISQKSFGDRNLDDWLRKDPDEELPQRLPRTKVLKCRKKCKKRKKTNGTKTEVLPEKGKDKKPSEKEKEKAEKPPEKEKPKKPEKEKPVEQPGTDNEDSYCKLENMFLLAAILLAILLFVVVFLVLFKVCNVIERIKSRFGGGGKKDKSKAKDKKTKKEDKKKGGSDAKKKDKEAKKKEKEAKKKEKEAKKKAKEAKKKEKEAKKKEKEAKKKSGKSDKDKKDKKTKDKGKKAKDNKKDKDKKSKDSKKAKDKKSKDSKKAKDKKSKDSKKAKDKKKKDSSKASSKGKDSKKSEKEAKAKAKKAEKEAKALKKKQEKEAKKRAAEAKKATKSKK